MASKFARLRKFLRSDASALLIAPASCVALLIEAYTRTEISDADRPKQCQYDAISNRISREHVQRLERWGFVILECSEAVVNSRTLESARAEVATYSSQGRFSSSQNGSDVRRDSVCWLRETDGTPGAVHAEDRQMKPLGAAMMHCAQILRGVAFALEQRGYQGSHDHRVPKQLQLGWYPGDWESGYMRHSDCCTKSISDLGILDWLRKQDYRERVLTAILYLNESNWRPTSILRSTSSLGLQGHRGDGGELRCYHAVDSQTQLREEGSKKGAQDSYTDVVPRGGTLIIFDSRRIEHQVLPGGKDRYALTCWINGKISIASSGLCTDPH